MDKEGKAQPSLKFYNNAAYFINEQLQTYRDVKNGLAKGELRLMYLNYTKGS